MTRVPALVRQPPRRQDLPAPGPVRIMRGPRGGLLAAVLALSFWLGGDAPARAADPYATSLDKRFSTSSGAPAPADPAVAQLESGLRKQVREMAERPEASPPEDAGGIEQFFLFGMGVAGALVLGLAAMIGLRRWNNWMDVRAGQRESARSALAEDPLMVEFLRALHDDLQSSQVALPQAPAASAEAGAVPNGEVPLVPAPDPEQELAVVRDQLAGLRADFQKVGRVADDAERLGLLRELVQRIETIKQNCGANHLRSVHLMVSALHGLLKQLSLKAANITPSALRTAATAMDQLEGLCTRRCRPDLVTAPPVRLLAVDDDAISLRAVALALKKAFNDSDLAPDGESALALAMENAYDVIFLDIEMPGMDGFELCAKIHATPLNQATPVVFVTSHSDFDSRAKSALVGAHDLIGKPFLAFEITVKALTLVLRARQERAAKTAPGAKEKAAPAPGACPAAARDKGSSAISPTPPCQPAMA